MVIIGELDVHEHAVFKLRIVLSHRAACISFCLSDHRSFKHTHNSTIVHGRIFTADSRKPLFVSSENLHPPPLVLQNVANCLPLFLVHDWSR